MWNMGGENNFEIAAQLHIPWDSLFKDYIVSTGKIKKEFPCEDGTCHRFLGKLKTGER
jgi:hypothetical protein